MSVDARLSAAPAGAAQRRARTRTGTEVEALTFVIAAGGTGGHVLPGLQVAAELRRRGHVCVIAGTARGLETRLAPAAGFPLELVPIGAFNRVSAARRLATLARAPRALWTAWRILRRRRPAALLSLGGYASGPLALAAVLSGIPLIVMEPNAYPGLANRLASRWARRALLGFAEAARYFPPGRSEVVGVPIRSEFFDLPRKSRLEPATVLVTGGSQGARSLNRAAVDAARYWAEKGFPGGLRLVHQTGPAEYNGIRAEYESLRPGPEIAFEAAPFLDDMPAAFAGADLVISRAGASALAELAAAGKASILVPFPAAADDHQTRNAAAARDAGAARLVPDAEWNGERMVREVGAILGAPGRLEAMEDAARARALRGAAERTADALIEEARRPRKAV